LSNTKHGGSSLFSTSTEFYGSFPVVPNMRGQAALSELGDDVFSRMISYRVSSSTSPSPPQML
jgi:hypothetical protein